MVIYIPAIQRNYFCTVVQFLFCISKREHL